MPVTEFPTYKGGKLIRSVCKPCYQRRNRDWRRANLHCPQCKHYRPRRMFYVLKGIEAKLCEDCRNGTAQPFSKQEMIREEYDFARSVLGMSHEAAFRWVREELGVLVETMNRAGVYIARPQSPTDVDTKDIELRKCKVCGKAKTLEQMAKTMQQGKRYYRHVCNRCFSDAAKDKRHKRAAEQGRIIRPRRMRDL